MKGPVLKTGDVVRLNDVTLLGRRGRAVVMYDQVPTDPYIRIKMIDDGFEVTCHRNELSKPRNQTL